MISTDNIDALASQEGLATLKEMEIAAGAYAARAAVPPPPIVNIDPCPNCEVLIDKLAAVRRELAAARTRSTPVGASTDLDLADDIDAALDAAGVPKE